MMETDENLLYTDGAIFHVSTAGGSSKQHEAKLGKIQSCYSSGHRNRLMDGIKPNVRFVTDGSQVHVESTKFINQGEELFAPYTWTKQGTKMIAAR